MRDEVSTVNLVELIVGDTDSDPVDSKETSGELRFTGLGRTRKRVIFRNISTICDVGS